MKTANQKGFSGMEVLVVIVTLTLVGGIGYWVYSQQSNKDSDASATNTSEQNSKDTSDQTSEITTPEQAAAKIGDKLNSLAGGKYTVEKLDGSATEIQTSADQTVAVTTANSIRYRSDPIENSTAAAYTAYQNRLANDLKALNTYTNNTLDLTQVYTHTETGPTGDDFVSTVYKVGDYYLEILGGNGFFDISWGK